MPLSRGIFVLSCLVLSSFVFTLVLFFFLLIVARFLLFFLSLFLSFLCTSISLCLFSQQLLLSSQCGPPIKLPVCNKSFGWSCFLRSPRRGDVPEPLPADDGVDWKKLSSEFRQILLDGALEPKEVHAKYHREFKKVRARPVDADMISDSYIGGG